MPHLPRRPGFWAGSATAGMSTVIPPHCRPIIDWLANRQRSHCVAPTERHAANSSTPRGFHGIGPVGKLNRTIRCAP